MNCRSRFRCGVFVFAVFLGVVGCATITALPPPENVAGKFAPEESAEARRLYINHCGRCHKFYDPRKYDDSNWKAWMSKMARKSRLTPSQEELLARYLELYRLSKTNP